MRGKHTYQWTPLNGQGRLNVLKQLPSQIPELVGGEAAEEVKQLWKVHSHVYLTIHNVTLLLLSINRTSWTSMKSSPTELPHQQLLTVSRSKYVWINLTVLNIRCYYVISARSG